eukprot:m.86826 g.86826  ORF g.86826 m.86826 type:complete len:67 (-) comp14482_c0_seq2:279-479(-)
MVTGGNGRRRYIYDDITHLPTPKVIRCSPTALSMVVYQDIVLTSSMPPGIQIIYSLLTIRIVEQEN